MCLSLQAEMTDLVNAVMISNDLTQMVNFPTRIHNREPPHSFLLDLFISPNASVSFTKALPPLGYSDHVFVSVSIEFPLNSKGYAPCLLHSLRLFFMLIKTKNLLGQN